MTKENQISSQKSVFGGEDVVVKKAKRAANPCDACSLSTEKEVLSSGDLTTAKVVFIGEAPGYDETVEGVPFVGRAGKLLRKTIEEAGIKDEDCYYANVCRCRPPGNRTPTNKEIACCMKYLREELADFKGLIVLLGATALSAFLRKGSIKNSRGYGFSDGGHMFFVTYHPSYISRKDEDRYYGLYREDMGKVGSWIDNEFDIDYGVLNTIKDIKEFVERSLESKAILTFDIETTGLNPFDEGAVVLSLAFSNGTHNVVIPLEHSESPFLDSSKDVIEVLKPLFSDKRVRLVAQSGKFDLNWLRVHYGLECHNYWFDTTLAHFLLEGKNSPSKLKEMAWKYTEYGGYDGDVDIESLRDTKFEKLSRYTAIDVLITHRIFVLLFNELNDNSLRLLTEIMCPSVSAFSEMEMDGLKIDYTNLEKFSSTCSNELIELEQKMHNYPAVVGLEKVKGDVINFNSSSQLVEVLKKIGAVPKIHTKKTKSVSTAEKSLETVKTGHPFVADLLKYKKQSKLYSTYLLPYLKDGKWWSEDGLAHGDYDFDRTNTGRTACRAPNLQNIPYPMRPIFMSKYGWFVEPDYSQLELRVIASLADERTLIAEFNDGKDAHELTREIMFGDNSNLSDTKKTEQRKKAKGVNFAVIYGTTKYGLATNLKVTQVKAQAWIDAYYEKYPAIAVYQRAMIKFAEDHGYIETPFGRKRYFNFKRAGLSDKDIEAMHREIKNTLPQSTASDVVVLATGNVWALMRSLNMKSRLGAYIHDNILVDMVEEEVEEFIPQLKIAMEDLEFDWLKVPLVVDIKVGTHWGRLEELDL